MSPSQGMKLEQICWLVPHSSFDLFTKTVGITSADLNESTISWVELAKEALVVFTKYEIV